MSKRVPSLIVVDILSCIEKILEYTKGYDFESFLTDGKTKDAVIRNIQIIGEAASRVPESIRKDHPTIEWTKMIRSRHIVTHDYDVVDETIIWRIVTIHLPEVKIKLEKILPLL